MRKVVGQVHGVQVESRIAKVKEEKSFKSDRSKDGWINHSYDKVSKSPIYWIMVVKKEAATVTDLTKIFYKCK